MSKSHTIKYTRRNRTSETSGTIDELITHFRYTLLKGYSWNKKVNKTPKTIKSLILNLNKATDSAAANGYGDTFYFQ